MVFVDLYNFLIHDHGDPRNKGHFFTDTPWPMFGIMFAYWYFVRVFGPRFMKDREPYKIERYIKIYNVIQIIWNLYLCSFVYELIYNVSVGEWDWFCIRLNYSTRPIDLRIRRGVHMYYYNKVFDLMDTVFFVLRKKFKQATYTHVHHHVIMLLFSWIGVKYSPGGNGIISGLFNGFVHVCMYIYYLGALMGVKEITRWKKHLTQLQLVQFVLVLVYCVLGVIRDDCGIKIMNFFGGLQAVYFIYLFSNFYIKTYLRPKNEKIAEHKK